MSTNKIISDMFAQMANISSKEVGVNPFKIAAYRKAAKVLVDYPIDIEEAYKKGGVKALLCFINADLYSFAASPLL